MTSIAAVVLGGVAVVGSLPWRTTYAAWSPALLVADAAATLALLAAGVFLWAYRPQDLRATLLVLLAGTWAAADWVGWQGGPDLVRTLGELARVAVLLLVIDLIARTMPSPRTRRVVPWLYAVTLAVSVTRLFVAAPLADPDCWQNCTANSLLVAGQPALATTLGRASMAVSAVMGAGLAIVALWLLLRPGPVAWRRYVPVLLPAAVLGAVTAGKDVVVLSGATEVPTDLSFRVLYALRALALAGVAVGFVVVVARSRRADRVARELADDLAQGTDASLATLLGRAMPDSTVTVAYWVPDRDAWVDQEGHNVAAPDRDTGRGVVLLTRAGRLVAAVSHDPSVATAENLEAALGPAARLAVVNESLRAQQLNRLSELRDSQRRIVEAADVERTRLEHNLHDASQVSVLALTAHVHRALTTARTGGDDAAHGLLASAATQVQATMDDLRRLAHGIHPVILELEGLEPALETLADGAPIRVEVDVAGRERLPAPLERAAYTVIAEALREAARLAEDDLLVHVERLNEWLVVRVEGTRQEPVHPITDRVESMGGHVVATGTSLEVRLPCA